MVSFKLSHLPFEFNLPISFRFSHFLPPDGAGQQYGAGGGYGGKFKRGPRRERDDKVHDSIIEERIQRERPCRTLFIRNIKASLGFEARSAFLSWEFFSALCF